MLPGETAPLQTLHHWRVGADALWNSDCWEGTLVTALLPFLKALGIEPQTLLILGKPFYLSKL